MSARPAGHRLTAGIAGGVGDLNGVTGSDVMTHRRRMPCRRPDVEPGFGAATSGQRIGIRRLIPPASECASVTTAKPTGVAPRRRGAAAARSPAGLDQPDAAMRAKACSSGSRGNNIMLRRGLIGWGRVPSAIRLLIVALLAPPSARRTSRAATNCGNSGSSAYAGFMGWSSPKRKRPAAFRPQALESHRDANHAGAVPSSQALFSPCAFCPSACIVLYERPQKGVKRRTLWMWHGRDSARAS